MNIKIDNTSSTGGNNMSTTITSKKRFVMTVNGDTVTVRDTVTGVTKTLQFDTPTRRVPSKEEKDWSRKAWGINIKA